jgi:glyoxylase-like metal-dependent hydrolase (beta-lactamase superfamily II)
VKRIRLNNAEFEGENVVYVLDDGEETALIDVGAASEVVRTDLREGLAELGVGFADVDTILLTHWHYDHCGLAGEIQAAGDATVYAHEADAGLIAGESRSAFDDPEQRTERLTEWGMPAADREALASFVDGHMDLAGESVDVTTVTDGETLSVAGVDLTVLHLPGHAAGLVAYCAPHDQLAATRGDDTVSTAVVEGGDKRPETAADGDDGRSEAAADGDDGRSEAAFVGDAILPRYTPNVGGADLRLSEPLADYVDSLVRLADRDPAVAYPGHRDPILDPAGRAREIVAHHRDRTQRVIDALVELGPATPWAVSAALFGDLAEIHILHGPGEAYAHLAHLAAAGVVERRERRYALTVDPATVDVSALFPPVDDTDTTDH